MQSTAVDFCSKYCQVEHSWILKIEPLSFWILIILYYFKTAEDLPGIPLCCRNIVSFQATFHLLETFAKNAISRAGLRKECKVFLSVTTPLTYRQRNGRQTKYTVPRYTIRTYLTYPSSLLIFQNHGKAPNVVQAITNVGTVLWKDVTINRNYVGALPTNTSEVTHFEQLSLSLESSEPSSLFSQSTETRCSLVEWIIDGDPTLRTMNLCWWDRLTFTVTAEQIWIVFASFFRRGSEQPVAHFFRDFYARY